MAATAFAEESLATAIDGEVRAMRRWDERRIQAYANALQPWAERFRGLDLHGLSLSEAHARCCNTAAGILPIVPPCP